MASRSICLDCMQSNMSLAIADRFTFWCYSHILRQEDGVLLHGARRRSLTSLTSYTQSRRFSSLERSTMCSKTHQVSGCVSVRAALQ